MSDVTVHTSMYWYVLVSTVIYHFGLLDVMYCAWEMCALILKHHETVLLYE